MTFKKNWLIILMIVLATLLTAKFALATHSSSPATATVNAVEGVEFVYQIPVTNGSGNFTFVLSGGAELGNLEADTGEFIWTPEVGDAADPSNPWEFTFTITDNDV